MTYTQIIKTSCGVLLFVFFYAFPIFGQSQKNYQDTLKILSEMDSQNLNSDKLAKLFRVGEERMTDLIKALGEPNPKISLRAQIVIRYLGNDVGVKSLFEWYDKQEQFPVAGPIPLPLTEWDYKVIYTNYINGSSDWTRAESYIYALAFEDSTKSREVLKEVIKSAGSLDEPTVVNRAIKQMQTSQPTKILVGKKDLAELILNNAFFVSSHDRKYTSARLLALNGAKNKGLIEVYINRGRLSEEWYHVVVQKCDQGWRFFSITQVAVS